MSSVDSSETLPSETSASDDTPLPLHDATRRPRPKLGTSSESPSLARGCSFRISVRNLALSEKFSQLQNFGSERDEVPDSIKVKTEVLLIIASSVKPGVLLSTAISAAVTALVTYGASDDSKWSNYLTESKTAVGIVGALLSFALVFRTNICYSRWWEGRCLWGQLIYASVHAAQQCRPWIADSERVKGFNNAVVTFAWACKAQLRGNGLQHDCEEGKKLVQRGVISQKELRSITLQPGWQPYYCFDVMRAIFTEAMSNSQMNTLKSDHMRAIAMNAMEDTMRDMATAIGGLIRVKSTGLPQSYNSFFFTFALLFIIMASFAWAPTMGWYTPVIITVISIILILTTEIGALMEDPFGLDLTDLPLKKYCKVIEAQVGAIQNRGEITCDLSIRSSLSGATQGDCEELPV